MSAEFGRLVREAMDRKGYSQGKLAALVGVFDEGRYLDATQVRLVTTGERRPTRGLVERLVSVLAPDLDPAEAWTASGLLPPDLTAEDLRAIWERAAARRLTAVGRVAQPVEGASATAAASSSSEPPDLMRACAPSAGQRLRKAA